MVQSGKSYDLFEEAHMFGSRFAWGGTREGEKVPEKFGWGCVAHYLTPFPYFGPKYLIFDALFLAPNLIAYLSPAL